MQASLKGASWSDVRSDRHLASTLLLGERHPVQLDPRWINDEHALSSIFPDMLQPLHQRRSEASPPCTTPTASMLESQGIGDAGTSRESEDGPKTWKTARQGEYSLPLLSPHPQSFNYVPLQTANSNAQLARLLEEVRRLQQDVRGKRSRARDLRRTLRRRREEEDYLRLVLRKKLSWIDSDTADQKTPAFYKAIEDLKAATELYHILESDYHRLEEELDQREDSLDRRMTSLNAVLHKQAASRTEPTDSVGSDPDLSSLSSAASTDTDAKRLLSKAAEYFALVGEVRMHRERLHELESDYMNLMDQEYLRERISLPFGPEELAFLAGYKDEKAKTEARLDHAIHRAVTHPEHKNHSEAAILDEQWEQAVRDFRPDSPENQAPRDPLRVTEFEDQSPFFEDRCPVALNKFTFVNRWLLHRLRHSSYETLQYKSNPELLDLLDEGWDGDSISQMALMLWFRDEKAGVVTARNNFVDFS